MLKLNKASILIHLTLPLLQNKFVIVFASLKLLASKQVRDEKIIIAREAINYVGIKDYCIGTIRAKVDKQLFNELSINLSSLNLKNKPSSL
jgi:hypothetical protein